MKERYLSKTPFLTFVYISKCDINLPCYFGNSQKRFLWTGLVCKHIMQSLFTTSPLGNPQCKHMAKTNSFLPTIWFSNLVFHFQWISRPRLVFDEYTVKFCSFSKSTWSRISTVPWPLPFRRIIIGNYQCHCHTHWSIIGDYQCHYWREPDVPASINNRSQGRGVALKLKLSRFKSSFFSRYFASH